MNNGWVSPSRQWKLHEIGMNTGSVPVHSIVSEIGSDTSFLSYKSCIWSYYHVLGHYV